MEREKVWLDWVIAQSPVDYSEQDAALKGVADLLDTATPETLIPLMTRWRPLPQILRLVRAYQRYGVESEEVRQFFLSAPRDVRNAFATLRREAM